MRRNAPMAWECNLEQGTTPNSARLKRSRSHFLVTLVSSSPSTAEYLAMASSAEGTSSAKEASRSSQNGIASVRGGAPVATADVGNDLMLALQRGDRPALDRLFSL